VKSGVKTTKMASNENQVLGEPSSQNLGESEPLLSMGKFPNQPASATGKITAPGKRGVNALQLTMMIYFFTSGGPFGIESAVGTAGPLLTLISLIVIPLFWSLPQALMAAELSLLISENGGNVVWVQAAFGDFIGWWNAYCNIIANFSSQTLLAVLFVDYINYSFNVWQTYLLKIGFILLNTVLNIGGLRWISRLSIFFLIFVISPFIAEFIMVGLKHEVKAHELAYIPPMDEINWGVFLSTVIWSYGGFDSIGSLAGEVKGGRGTFMKGIFGSIPLIFLNYFFPIWFGYCIDPHWTDWQSGYFTKVAYQLTKWLGIWMVAASAVSNFGQFNAAMATQSRVIWAMAQSEGTSQKLPSFLSWSWQRHTGTIRPIAAVLFCGTMCAALTTIPFNILVQIFLVIRVFNLLCEYAALIRLRYTRRDDPRPFEVPGGLVGVWLMGVPTLVLSIFTIVKAQWEVWVAGAATHVGILLLYGLKIGFVTLRNRMRAKQSKKELIN